MRKKKAIRINFSSDISQACSKDPVRFALNYVFFNEKNAIATNGHVLVVSPLEYHSISDECQEKLEGKFLHRDSFKLVYQAEVIKVKEEGIDCIKGNCSYFVKFNDFDDKFPDYKNVIPNRKEDRVEIDELGININLMTLVKKITVDKKALMKHEFFGKTKCIIISPNDSCYNKEIILVMPIMLDSYV